MASSTATTDSVENSVSNGTGTPSPAPSTLTPELARHWLQQLSSPIDELKGKIKETQNAISTEKRKSLSRKTSGAGKNRNNRNQGGQASSPSSASAIASQRAIEVMETLLTVYREELSTMENFVKVVAVYVIKSSSEEEAADQNLISLLQPYQPLLKGLAPKNSLQVKTPIRRNSSKRNSGRNRNRSRRSNSQNRASPDKLKMKEIVDAIKGDEKKEGENDEKVPQVDVVLGEREKLLGLQYFGAQFADALKLEVEEANVDVTVDSEKEKVVTEKSSTEEEALLTAEPIVDETDSSTVEVSIPEPVEPATETPLTANEVPEPAAKAEFETPKPENGETVQKEDDNVVQSETLVESQSEPKTYAEAASTEETSSTSIPKFYKLVDPIPSENIVSVVELSETVVEAIEHTLTQTTETKIVPKPQLENDKPIEIEITASELSIENTITVTEVVPEPKVDDAKVETASTEVPENTSTPPKSPKSTSDDNTTSIKTATITKSDSTILNENPSLALPVISSPILPRGDFPTTPQTAVVLPTEKVKPADVDSPSSHLSEEAVFAEKKENISNTEILDQIVEAAERAKETITLLKPTETEREVTPTDNKYGTFSEPKPEAEEKETVNEIPGPAAKAEFEVQKPVNDEAVSKKETNGNGEAAKGPQTPALKNGSSSNNNNKTDLKKRSSSKKEKKSKNKRSATGADSTGRRSKSKACCSIM